MRTQCLRAIFPVLALVGLPMVPPDAAAQQGQPQTAASAPADTPWGIEVTGGWSGFDPDDLNAFSRQRQVLFGDYYVDQVAYYRRVYGASYFQGTTTAEGAFPIIEGTRAAGVRLSRRLVGRVTALLGFDYANRSMSEDVTRGYEQTIISPHSTSLVSADTVTYSLSPERLAVRSLTPTLGARVALLHLGPLAFDAQARGGLTWARIEIEEHRNQTTTQYRQQRAYTERTEGRGRGATGEVGLRVSTAGWRRLSMFIEGSYQWQRVKKLTGTTTSNNRIQDGDATSLERETSTTRAGDLRIYRYTVSPVWQTYQLAYPYAGTGYSPFVLDLSGPRLRIGVAYRFRRVW